MRSVIFFIVSANTEEETERTLMSKDTIEATRVAGLFETMCDLLGKVAASYGQERLFVNSVMLLIGMVATVGRHTLTQLLLTLGREEEDWSRYYRLFSCQRFDEEAHYRMVAEQTIAETDASEWYVVGVDGTHIPRSRVKTATVGWFKQLGGAAFRSGLTPGQRFSHCAALLPAGEGRSRAIPIRFAWAPQRSAVAQEGEVVTEWAAALATLRWLRSVLDRAGRTVQRVLVLGDGSYDQLELWCELPKGMVMLVRTARNRVLHALPTPVKGKRKRGRPALYGERLPPPHDYLRERSKLRECTVPVRHRTHRLRYRLVGPVVREGLAEVPLFLLVVAGGSRKIGKRNPKSKRLEPAYYLVSAVRHKGEWQLPLSVETLLTWTWQRWELEIAHREMKSGAKVGQMQCWNAHGIVLSVQWAVWVYALCIFTAWRTWGASPGPKPPGKWRRNPNQRWSYNTVWRCLRSELARQPHFSSLCTVSTANWQKIESWSTTIANAALNNGAT